MNRSRTSSKYRIIDANLNRACEGLRVIEDVCRFILTDQKATLQLRRFRHRLTRLTEKIYPQLIASRDSRKDPGRSLPENKRKNCATLLIANFRRLEEALRVLEEFSRLISAQAGEQLKKMRFQSYTLEKEIVSKWIVQ